MQSPLELKPWALPLLVLSITLPIAVAMLLGGPVVGLAVGALMAAVIIVVASRLRPDEPIEVAASANGRLRILVVAGAAIDEPPAIEEIARAAHRGGEEAEVLVVAPALNRPISHWFSDLRAARDDAQRRLVLTQGALAAANLDARGQVGDTDPLQAVEDALREFPADQVVIATAPPEEGGERFVAEIRRRLDLPLTHLVVGPEADPRRS